MEKIPDRQSQDDAKRPLTEVFFKLRQLCAEEGYELKTPPRRNRPNVFADATLSLLNPFL